MWHQVRARRALPRQKREQGSGLAELAVVLFLLLVVLAGIADVGLALNHYIVICNASREGARFGSYHPASASGIVQAAINEGAGGGLTLTADDVTISGLYAPGGSPIRVLVTYQMPTMLGGLIGLGSHLTLRSATEMVVLPGGS